MPSLPLIEVLPAEARWSPDNLWPIFASRPGCAFLDSSLAVSGSDQFSILACDPWATLRADCKGATLLFADGKSECFPDSDPLKILKEILAARACQPIPGIPFIGGAIGWLGYEAGAMADGISGQNPSASPAMPGLCFGLYDSALVYDHSRQRATLIAPDESHLDRLRALLTSPPPASADAANDAAFPSRPSPVPDLTPEAYNEAIRKIRDYIAAGDTYQVNFTHRFTCPFSGSASALYQRLRTLSPAPHSAYFDFGDHQIVSSTPERLLRVSGRRLESRPIKGTVARHPEDAVADATQRARLLSSAKDHAELLMIVDLVRNDLGRVATAGSVHVSARHELETYATVHHLVATVIAELAAHCDRFDAIRALHPGGSITGAPKIRAMQIIAELEPVPRHAYTGALGYLGYDGDADLAIAIRTITCAEGLACYHVGGGITWDSAPSTEYEETLHKGRAMQAALSHSQSRF